MEDRFAPYALSIPRVLLPDESVDLTKWAVLACDQFSSQPEYWDRVAKDVAGLPSAYHIIYPECYLHEGEARIDAINKAMREYRDSVLTRAYDGFVLVERETHSGLRLGLVAEVDLDAYDYSPGTKSLIRPTEGTIEERLPPRVAIRKDACLESPHIMLLADDPNKTLIEPIYRSRAALLSLYDFELMSGGRIRGWLVSEEAHYNQMQQALSGLLSASDGLLFAVGDGNHSLATAKKCWMELRETLSEAERAKHPARFALVEIVNLHDPAMVFEPIHRAVFQAGDCAVLTHDFVMWARKNGMSVIPASEENAQMRLLDAPVRIENAINPLPVANLQPFLDEWILEHPGASIDYIHGTDALMEMAAQGACCIQLTKMDKYALFQSVRRGGPLPRKTFSMGEATDKRYYLECRGLTMDWEDET